MALLPENYDRIVIESSLSRGWISVVGVMCDCVAGSAGTFENKQVPTRNHFPPMIDTQICFAVRYTGAS